MSDEFYDLCFEAWMIGRNPDSVSRDDFDYLQSRGFSPEEISLTDVCQEPDPNDDYSCHETEQYQPSWFEDLTDSKSSVTIILNSKKKQDNNSG